MVAMGLQEKAERRRLIDRVWASSLSGSEQKVLTFIFTVTTEWGKVSDHLKLDHFVHGVGKTTGTGLSKITVRRALESLIVRGIVSRRRFPYGCYYSINFDWRPDIGAHVDGGSE